MYLNYRTKFDSFFKINYLYASQHNASRLINQEVLVVIRRSSSDFPLLFTLLPFTRPPQFLFQSKFCSTKAHAMDLVQQNILTAFQELGASVSAVLHTHLGNATKLNEQKQYCLLFLGNIQQVSFRYSTRSIWILLTTQILASSAHECRRRSNNHNQH